MLIDDAMRESNNDRVGDRRKKSLSRGRATRKLNDEYEIDYDDQNRRCSQSCNVRRNSRHHRRADASYITTQFPNIERASGDTTTINNNGDGTKILEKDDTITLGIRSK